MNITLNRSIIILMIFLSCYIPSYSEDSEDMSINTEITFGLSYNITKLSENTDANIALNSSIRLLWDTDTRLNLGLEAGIFSILRSETNGIVTEFGITDLKTSIETIPIMFVINMNFAELDFYAGAGISLTYSIIEAYSEKAISNIMNGSYMFSVSYSLMSFTGFNFGVETGIYYITDVDAFLHKINFKANVELFSW